ncbi:RICIN domain-containing protein [Saccharothrix sp. MB29]|nr:RICIN domain-containing protein [Saccharothrix sp. MB29]
MDTNAWYQLVSRHSGKAVDVCDQSTADRACVQQWAPLSQANQQFQFVSSGDGYYRLKARHSGKVVDVLDWSTADGAELVQWPDTGAASQRWRSARHQRSTSSWSTGAQRQGDGRVGRSAADGGRISRTRQRLEQPAVADGQGRRRGPPRPVRAAGWRAWIAVWWPCVPGATG